MWSDTERCIARLLDVNRYQAPRSHIAVPGSLGAETCRRKERVMLAPGRVPPAADTIGPLATDR
jgi:hypothetical protein